MSAERKPRKRAPGKHPAGTAGKPGRAGKAEEAAQRGNAGKRGDAGKRGNAGMPGRGAPGPRAMAEIPPRMVGIAYVLALLCLVTPLTVLGSGFAGAVLFTRGMRREGAGVIVVSVVCVAVGFYLRTQ